jgi:hypothetical protein
MADKMMFDLCFISIFVLGVFYRTRSVHGVEGTNKVV